MTVRAGLFARLRAESQRLDSRAPHEQLVQHVAAIKAHLQQLLNTRRGCSQSSPELGLADFNSQLRGADLLTSIATDIRRTLCAYEPRLEILGLHFRTDPQSPLELEFRLDCQVRFDRQLEKVCINLRIDHQHTYVE